MPAGTKFTPADVPNLTGKVIVVTGGNSGIGFEAAKVFADRGAQVVLACRNEMKAEVAVGDICRRDADACVDAMILDLSKLESVRAFVEKFKAKYEALHVLCNNAGVMAIPRTETADGFEMQIGTNHFGHFALTGLLLDSLRKAGGGRVVNVSSQAHRGGKMRFSDIHWEEKYDKWAAYGQSKLANLLFTFELNRRLDASKEDMIAVAAHPGYAATNLQYVGPEMRGSGTSIWKMANSLLAQSQEMGALPTIYAATMPDVRGGDYYGPAGVMEMWGYPKKVGTNERAQNKDAQRKLWDISEELTGVTWDALQPA